MLILAKRLDSHPSVLQSPVLKRLLFKVSYRVETYMTLCATQHCRMELFIFRIMQRLVDW